MDKTTRAKGDKVALIVVDMTEEQFNPGGSPLIANWPGHENILKLAKTLPKDRVFDCHLWMSESDHSSLHELYPEVGLADSKGAQLCQELKGLEPLSTFVKKVQYSCFFGSTLQTTLQEQKVGVVMLTGINTDYCVFTTALDAFYFDYEVWLIQDCCASITGRRGHKHGISEFERFLGHKGKVFDTQQALREISLSNNTK